MIPLEKKRIIVNGLDIAYYECGNGDVPLLMIHGNSLSADIFIKQLNSELLNDEFKIWAIDLAGCGDSGRSNHPEIDYTIPGQAHLVNQFCQKFKINKPLLVGHSLGGNILIECMQQGLVASYLLLIGSLPAPSPFNMAMFKENAAAPLFFTPHLTPDQIQIMAVALLGDKGTTGIISIIEKADPLTRHYLFQLIASGNYKDQCDTLKQLNWVVAVCVGEFDQLLNIEFLKEINCDIYNHHLTILKKGSHLPFFDSADEFNNLIISLKSELN